MVTGATLGQTLDVLMIAVDDLRPELACTDMPGYARPTLHTPHICALARKSLVLQRSHVAMSTCSPSRTALLTGRHAGTTRVWDLFSYWRQTSGNFTTIPQYFKEKGFLTAGMGKIFHPGHASAGDDVAYSWTEPYFHGKDPVDKQKEKSWMAVPESVTSSTPLQDTQTMRHAVETLQGISARRRTGEDARNFFVAVGFIKPHLPFVFPAKYLEHYPASATALPTNPFAPEGMPTIAWQRYGETRSYHDVAATGATGDINTTLPDYLVRELRRAYYASVSFTDDNVGFVLEALTSYGLADGTVVVFWGDHGWHLGEHGEWDKHTNFALNTHAPLFFRVPGLTDGGIESYQLTETVDIFPTLVELALNESLPTCPPESSRIATCTEGTSLRPLIREPTTPVKRAAFSVYTRPVPHPREATDIGDRSGVWAMSTPNGADEAGSVSADEAGGGGVSAEVPSPSGCLDEFGRGRGCVMGYSMMTRADGVLLRYTEWVRFPGPSHGWKPQWAQSYGTELYNHSDDAAENINIIARVTGTPLARTLSTRLRGGWPANLNMAEE